MVNIIFDERHSLSGDFLLLYLLLSAFVPEAYIIQSYDAAEKMKILYDNYKMNVNVVVRLFTIWVLFRPFISHRRKANLPKFYHLEGTRS